MPRDCKGRQSTNGISDVQSSERHWISVQPRNIMIKNQKNSKKKSKRLANAQQMIATNMEHQYVLGHCAQKYAASLADPFSGPPDACMPVTPAVLSRKARFFIRTQLVTSATSGDGFCTMQPFAGNNGSTAAGNIGTAAAYTSSSSYVGGGGAGIPVLDPAIAGVIGNNHNGDYAIASFTSLYSRLVSMGFRIRYAGTELNRGGRIVLLEDPEHNTLANTTLTNLLANEKTKEHKIGTDWVTLCTTGPTLPSEYDYLAGPYLPYGSSVLYAHYLAAYIRSAALNQVFDVEFFWNFEFTGSVPRGKTPSEADDAGVGVVLGAIKSVNDNQLDSKHPLVQSSTSVTKAAGGSPAQSAAILNGLVQRYAQKNASGWFAKAVKGVGTFAKNAEHYIERGAQIAGAAAPLLALL